MGTAAHICDLWVLCHGAGEERKRQESRKKLMAASWLCAAVSPKRLWPKQSGGKDWHGRLSSDLHTQAVAHVCLHVWTYTNRLHTYNLYPHHICIHCTHIIQIYHRHTTHTHITYTSNTYTSHIHHPYRIYNTHIHIIHTKSVNSDGGKR